MSMRMSRVMRSIAQHHGRSRVNNFENSRKMFNTSRPENKVLFGGIAGAFGATAFMFYFTRVSGRCTYVVSLRAHSMFVLPPP